MKIASRAAVLLIKENLGDNEGNTFFKEIVTDE